MKGAARPSEQPAARASDVVRLMTLNLAGLEKDWFIGRAERLCAGLTPLEPDVLCMAKCIQPSATATSANSTMKQLVQIPVRSLTAPNTIGRTKPPRPPTSPTRPPTEPT